jgi:NitT/TauT family transport system permease protein
MPRFPSYVIWPLLFTIALFAVWEVVCRGFAIPPSFLPSPSMIFKAMWQFRATLVENSLVTLWTTLMGFGIAIVVGLLLGVFIGASKGIYEALYPVMIGFNSIPKVAIVPVLILWFGVGPLPSVLTAFLISFFPIVVNVATGLATTEPELRDVLRALGATRFEIIRKVGLPRSMPYFFSSLKVAVTLAFVGSVMAETVGSNKGVGHLMLSAQSAFQVPLVFAGLLALAVLGIVLYAMMAIAERRFTSWAYR